jgi:hypothetical protein
MALINLSMKHGTTQEEARSHLERAVGQVASLFGPMLRHTAWSADRNSVRLDGAGFWVEMRVDAQEVHATGDLPALGQLLAGPLASGLTAALRKSFPKSLP